MPDRYDELMQRRSMLLAEARRHMRDFQERIGATDPTVSVRFEWSGPVLCADGRLLLTVDESDEHQEQRTYSVWSELDGASG